MPSQFRMQAPVVQPFYYYQGRAIQLEVDPRYLVVGTDQPNGVAVVSTALSDRSLQVSETKTLSNIEGLWAFRVTGTSAQVSTAETQMRLDPRFTFVSTAFRKPGAGTMFPVNRVGVRFRAGVTRRQIDSLSNALGTRVIREPRPDSGFVEYWLGYPGGADGAPLRVAAAYSENPLVLYAEADMVEDFRPTSVPTDPYYQYQYYLKNSAMLNGVRVDIDVEAAWDLEPTKGGGIPSEGGFTIAVIDDGVQAAHPDFGGQVEPGYDVFGDGLANNPNQDPSHGTHVAGIISGQHNDAGVAGVAPGARVVPVRIFRPTGSGSNMQTADGIRYAWFWAGAAVLNNSWGRPDTFHLGSNAITNAINDGVAQGRNGKGAIFVFGVGNESRRGQGQVHPVFYPAWLPNVIAVGAIDRNGAISDYSNEGPELQLVAPSAHWLNTVYLPGNCGGGGDVVTIDQVGNAGCSNGPDGNPDYTQTFTGTSAATPQVSGVAALVLVANPNLTWQQLRSRLLANADPWGPQVTFGAGKVNARRAILGEVSPSPLSAAISGPTVVNQVDTCWWTGFASGGTPPYTYQWSGALSGTGAEISGADVFGDLYLTVTSGDGQVAEANPLFITQDEEASC